MSDRKDQWPGVLSALQKRGALLDDGTLHKGALISRREAEAFTHRSKASIYRDMERGEFPKPIRTGQRAVAWRGEDLNRWKESREVELT